MTSGSSTTAATVADATFGTPDDYARMTQMIVGYRLTQIASVASAYNLPEHLGNGPRSAQEIATAEALNEDATFRFMRACASVGLMTYDEPTRRFAATSLLGTLRKDNPRSLRSRAMLQTFDPFWRSFGRLAQALRSGKPQAVDALGCSLWNWLGERPDDAAIFADAMKGFSQDFGPDVMALIDTQRVRLAVDVGGASGSFVHTLMQHNPQLQGAVFDLPFVVAKAADAARTLGIEARFSTFAGDFLKDPPPAADLYLLRFILHDWDDESCIAILRNCRRSLDAGGRVLVSEMLVADHGSQPTGPLLDLMMMVTLGGKERSREQFETLFAAAGFRLTSVKPTSTVFSLLEAEPV
ncbi:methyltransferase [Paraburkholderia jirisanensis]